jgi:hypothetical protein
MRDGAHCISRTVIADAQKLISQSRAIDVALTRDFLPKLLDRAKTCIRRLSFVREYVQVRLVRPNRNEIDTDRFARRLAFLLIGGPILLK